MVNLQSSIDELQKKYNELYEAKEKLESDYQLSQKKKNRKERNVRYQIEKNKLDARICIMKQCIKSLQEEQKQIKDLSNKYRVDYKQEIGEDWIHNVNDRQMEIESQLEEQYESMDTLVTQETLEQEYRKYTLGRGLVMPTAMMIGMCFSIMCYGIFGRLITSQFLEQLLVPISFVASSSISAFSIIRQNHNCKRLFRKMGRVELPDLLLEEQSYRMANQEGKCKWLMDDIIKTQLELQQHFRFIELWCKRDDNETETPLYKQNLAQTNKINLNPFETKLDDKKKVK